MAMIPAYFLPIEIDGEEYVSYSSYKKSVDDNIGKINELMSRVYELEQEKRSEKSLRARYQSDCITINQLQTTIDILVDKLARLREVHGL